MTSTLDSSSPVPRTSHEQLLLIEAITTLFEHKISFNEFVGFKIARLDPQPVLINFDMRPELVGHFLYGRLHGGVISSVLDVAGGLAVMMGIANFHAHESCDEIMQRFAPLSTIDMRVDYLRQGIGQTFTADASIVRLGRRVAVCSMRLSNEENTLIATGSATYMVS
ncbi:thioesterase family protein [Granulosicoccus sp.]|nr:thioesterase family protein [Granulosicoccus sp.]MDB4222857.1 thioesterase family protein [Granulosicoccus sp.]